MPNTTLEMSEFGNSARAEFCAELAIVRRINKAAQNCEILQIIFQQFAAIQQLFRHWWLPQPAQSILV